MSEKKGWGNTVLGWFVVRDGERDAGGAPQAVTDAPKADDADALIARYAAAEPPPPSPVELKGDVKLPASPDAPIDFKAVYHAAGLGALEMERVDKALALLGTLPAETPKETKRQIVEASLKAFGVPVVEIIEAGAQEIQALQAYIEVGQRETQKVMSDASEHIAALEKEIADVKALMERKVAAQTELTRRSNQEKLRIQEVLEFFGQEAVAKVVRESPKLHEPGAAATGAATNPAPRK